MKLSLPLSIAGLAAVGITTITPAYLANAQVLYEEKEVDESNFVVVAAPFGENRYNLLVIEQIPNKKQCWSESGSNPTVIDPLLLNFDFTGSCSRKTDSNGYSIRVDGTDYGLEYRLDVVERENELYLIGAPALGSNVPEVVVGRSYGMGDGFLKIELEPGWRLSKRTYQNKTLGHVYFSGESIAFVTPGGPAPAFRDIIRDIYRAEIEKSVELGFISGFQDKTFRPKESLTRAQIVSMVFESLKTVPDVDATLVESLASSPYPDVPTSYWAATKIQWAKDSDIVTGYEDGTFKPNKPVTRAELMAILKKAAEYTKTQQGQPVELVATTETRTFSDISGHWGETLVTQMSSYCQVASPLNESGDAFYPDNPSQRNYAAAATLRTLNCLEPSANQP